MALTIQKVNGDMLSADELNELVAEINGKQDRVIGTEIYTTAEKTKLAGIAPSATANDTDANLKNRGNHTGTQLANTISDFATAADARITVQKGVASGLAPLGSDQKVPATYLPSYVDDVLEYTNLASFPSTGETGKIYTALDTGKIYRWSGSTYLEISASPGSTDAVTEGVGNLYFTESRVRASVLTGLSAAVSRVLPAATDSILTAWGKVLKYLTDLGALAYVASTSAALDLISSTRGTVLFRGAAGWSALAPGTAGQVLQTGGAGADPSWATVASGGGITKTTGTSTSQTLTFISAGFAHHRHTTSGNTTFTFASVSSMDGEKMTVRVTIGSAGHTIAFKNPDTSDIAAAKWPTGAVPTFKTTANYVYILQFIVDNAVIRCTGITEYSS